MNKRALILILAVLIIGTFCLLLWPGARTPKVAHETLPSGSPAPAHTPGLARLPSGNAPGSAPNSSSKEERLAQILSLTSMTPIAFYGKVVDQHNNPVPGAKVRGNVETSRQWMEQKWDEHFTVSDDEGHFVFTGLHGQELVVSLSKKGYDSKESTRNFAYSALTPERERHRPDRAAPVVFKIWKQQGAEPLISGDKFLGIKADGTPFTIDLVKGRKSEGRAADGDLVVSINQPSQITNGQRFEWSFHLRPIAGGLADVADEQYPYEAPEKGYLPELSQTILPTDSAWADVVRKTLYITARDGAMYAWARVEIHANYQGAAVFAIRYVLNPAGSRNLDVSSSQAVETR